MCVVRYAQITQNNKFRGIQFLCFHKMIKIWTPPQPLLALAWFWYPSPPPYCERSKLYINHPLPPITKILNSVIFILFHNQWLESALINARKNYLLIWRFPMFAWIQFHNHQLQSALINTRKNVLLMCHKKVDLAWIICNFASNIKQI